MRVNGTKKSSLGGAANKIVAGNSVALPGLVDFYRIKPAVETAGYFHPSLRDCRSTSPALRPARDILFRRQPDDFAQGCLRFEVHKAFQFFHERFAAAHVVKARRICLIVWNQFNL